MAGIHDQFIFNLIVPGGMSQQAYPIAKELRWKYSFDDKFPRMTLDTALEFYDDYANDIKDFTAVYPLERERRRCDKIILMISKRCPNGAVTEWWQGYFYVSDCDWDVSSCSFKVKPKSQDDYQCILDKWKKELNVLEYGEPVQLRDIYGTLERKTCEVDDRFEIDTTYEEYQDEIFDITSITTGYYAICTGVKNEPGWTLLENSVSWYVEQHPFFPNVKVWHVKAITTWIREYTSEASPPGIGWEADSNGGFARPVDVVLVEAEEGANFYKEIYESTVIGIIQGALYFNEVIENILLDYCPGLNLVSNYFTLNPDGTEPNNAYYTWAKAQYSELYIIPKSEVLYVGASDRATGTPGVTFEKILNDLENMFGVVLRVKDDKYRLEHYSYFSGTAMLNLADETNPDFVFYMKKKFKYRYLNTQIPISEEFFFMDITDETGDFDYALLQYDSCSVNQGDEKPIRNECTSTNLSGIVASGKKDDGKASAKGICIAAGLDGVIGKYTGYISGKAKTNAILSWPILIKNNLTYERPLRQAKFYNEFLDFVREWPVRIWEGKVCISCEDIELFDMEDLVRTCLPWGKVQEANWINPSNELELKVLHE